MIAVRNKKGGDIIKEHMLVQTPTPSPGDIPLQLFDKQEVWEPVRRKPVMAHRLRTQSSEHWLDLFRFRHSVVPQVALPCLIITAWSALICTFYLIPDVAFLSTLKVPNSTLFLLILGTTVSLLLAFRLNNSYDRFWEGRKTWTNLHYQLRNLARLIWVYCPSSNAEESNRKVAAMNLLIAFSTATKHELRDEIGTRYTDLGPFMKSLPVVAPKLKDSSHLNPSLQILKALQLYICESKLAMFPMTSAITSLNDSLSVFERIKKTPIPAAYSIHLRQSLVLYMLSFPFQLVPSALGWWTIPVTFLTCFVVFGIEVIGVSIENPFGYDANDLEMDLFCDAIQDEINRIVSNADDKNVQSEWIAPYSLDVSRVDLKKLKEGYFNVENSASTFKGVNGLLSGVTNMFHRRS